MSTKLRIERMFNIFDQSTLFFTNGYLLDMTDRCLIFQKYHENDIAVFSRALFKEFLLQIEEDLPLYLTRDKTIDQKQKAKSINGNTYMARLRDDDNSFLMIEITANYVHGRCLWEVEIIDHDAMNVMVFKNDHESLAAIFRILI